MKHYKSGVINDVCCYNNGAYYVTYYFKLLIYLLFLVKLYIYGTNKETNIKRFERCFAVFTQKSNLMQAKNILVLKGLLCISEGKDIKPFFNVIYE